MKFGWFKTFRYTPNYIAYKSTMIWWKCINIWSFYKYQEHFSRLNKQYFTSKRIVQTVGKEGPCWWGKGEAKLAEVKIGKTFKKIYILYVYQKALISTYYTSFTKIKKKLYELTIPKHKFRFRNPALNEGF